MPSRESGKVKESDITISDG